ncbi:ferritin-like domain-containing protein [Devosia sediminis]|uniref:Ferritin-like domain-containing protein n=1 Tax=Devosia sediminis TaxID=2798801 RepID=A0A934J2L9_9HYPH|nr:ferritin-like domain-containing protein [Devosia sediminis]MBJ3786539.1 ferritin-like domain-containing protein [Devosia sediminis]
MTNPVQTSLLSGIDPEITARLSVDRRAFFKRSVASLGMLASAPMVLAVTAQQAFGQSLPAEIKDVLNYALTLEHIEDFFYRSGLEADGLIPHEYMAIFTHIGLHEAQHVALLESVLGADAVARPEIDATAGGQYADVLTNFDTYLTLSQTFEDLGVAAYKGQAGNLIGNNDLLQTALQIHSVEARHAAIVRKIGGKKPWDGAYDEPMSKEDVLAAAQPFLA